MVEELTPSPPQLDPALARSAPFMLDRPVPALHRGELHVWHFQLDVSQEQVRAAGALLDDQETARAGRFRFDVHRSRFIVGRATLRALLGKYLACEATSLTFEIGPYGKPALMFPAASELAFNLSHSGYRGLLAIGAVRTLGADIEQTIAPPEMQELVARFFCRGEARLFSSLRESEKPQAFFNLWTRKEAYLKATGLGISHLLNEVQVSFLPGEKPELLDLPNGGDPRAWHLFDVFPGSGFTGCVCASSEAVASACFNLQIQPDCFAE